MIIEFPKPLHESEKDKDFLEWQKYWRFYIAHSFEVSSNLFFQRQLTQKEVEALYKLFQEIKCGYLSTTKEMKEFIEGFN